MPTAPGLPPRPPKHTPPRRLSTEERGYGTEHRRTRARLIALYPVCQRCAADWSHHLHHRDRDTSNRAESNLELLCVGCHQAEHRAG
jgi:5-methylcytosine-specific restriction endonuclease McrA